MSTTSTGAATHRTDGPAGEHPGRAVGLRGGVVRHGVVRGVASGLGHVLGAGFGLAARVRADKPIHPAGTVLHGRLHRDGTGSSGAPWIDARATDPVVVRWSRGGGFPSTVPDVHGLALRLGQVDLLLAAVLGLGPVTRHVLRLTRDAARGPYATLMPFRGPHGPLEIAAQPEPGRSLPASPDALAAVLEERPLTLRLAWATPTGPWHRFGELEIDGSLGPVDLPVRFDPERAPAGLAVYDGVARLREPSYAAARRRHPTGARTTDPRPGDAPTTTTIRTASRSAP